MEGQRPGVSRVVVVLSARFRARACLPAVAARAACVGIVSEHDADDDRLQLSHARCANPVAGGGWSSSTSRHVSSISSQVSLRCRSSSPKPRKRTMASRSASQAMPWLSRAPGASSTPVSVQSAPSNVHCRRERRCPLRCRRPYGQAALGVEDHGCCHACADGARRHLGPGGAVEDPGVSDRVVAPRPPPQMGCAAGADRL